MKLFARGRPDKHAMGAGRWKRAVATAVCITLPSLFRTKLTKLGHHQPREMTIKEEPKSPGCVTTRKRKAYSTTNTNLIGVIEPINDANADPVQPAGKRVKITSTSTSHVQFDGVSIPKATRKLTRVHKARNCLRVSERSSPPSQRLLRSYLRRWTNVICYIYLCIQCNHICYKWTCK